MDELHKKCLAECIGTAVLVLVGCAAVTLGGYAGPGATRTLVDVTGIAFAFGLSVTAMAYGIGPVSGCHINPAVTIGMLLCSTFNLGAAGRISGITTTIIMLVPHAGAFWQFALFRLGEVTLGATAALLVTRAFGLLERRWFGDAPRRDPPRPLH